MQGNAFEILELKLCLYKKIEKIISSPINSCLARMFYSCNVVQHEKKRVFYMFLSILFPHALWALPVFCFSLFLFDHPTFADFTNFHFYYLKTTISLTKFFPCFYLAILRLNLFFLCFIANRFNLVAIISPCDSILHSQAQFLYNLPLYTNHHFKTTVCL
jgi:hypothetical protein